MPEPSKKGYWNNLWTNGGTRWDLGQGSPPLQAYFEQLADRNVSMLIPGCGNAYEALWLQQQGFSSVALVDISDMLVARLGQKFRGLPGPAVHLITGDFFDLAGLLFDRDFPGDGPPFGGHGPEYRRLIEKKFTVKTLEPCYNSIKSRAGTALFLVAEKPF